MRSRTGYRAELALFLLLADTAAYAGAVGSARDMEIQRERVHARLSRAGVTRYTCSSSTNGLHVTFNQAGVVNLSLLRGVRLSSLVLHRCRATNLAAIVDTGVDSLTVSDSSIDNMFALRNLPLRHFKLAGRSSVPDFSSMVPTSLEHLEVVLNPLADIDWVRNLKLRRCSLLDTKVSDVSSMKGQPLTHFDLHGSPVRDLSPLAGAPLEWLNIYGTLVSDLKPLRSIRSLKVLSAGRTQIGAKALGDLAGSLVEALDVSDTQVADISPLVHTGVRCLNVAGTKVEDFAPLAKMPIETLIFSPEKATSGIDELRRSATLTRLGTDWGKVHAPARFWHLYDSGLLSTAGAGGRGSSCVH